ncbi:alkylated DNA repair alkB-like protein 8 [Micractinium conductrix]|uniref:Alkylated DNA repair alkB-like protein 8 n=1 Tax=Micractinium conductrix TaxID=554055 RepID=A0A2P6VDS4_9CHLO|nr:alkylated DNA repair alkB-like protein 8 [Micractinium conductrix]|eukprot:PSC72219.1 alkylated DNA repair alkB-like protein 8 [Micractinium conductrix]
MARERGGFCRPRGPQPTRHLLLGNVGPTPDAAALADLLAPFNGGHPPHITLPGGALGRTHCFASLSSPEAAAAAKAALHCACCASLGGRPLSLSFAEQRDDAPSDGASASDAPVVAVRTAAECGIPGLALLPGFVSAAEEAALLAEADAASHWQPLARRRVLHFGHVFDYETRGVGEPLHSIPPAARALADRIQGLPAAPAIDQLTVNEYAPGVGISPHVETHSAFTGAIVALSLGGTAAMSFRREGHTPRALFLPPRSLLIMAGEARYAWQHSVPQRKTDLVSPDGGAGEAEAVPRAPRRVSLTFRQVRGFPCDCSFPAYCDSQLAPLAPTRLALARMALKAPEGGVAAAAAGREGPAAEQQQQQGRQEEQQQAQQHSDGDDAVLAAAAAADPALDRQLAALEAQHVHAVYNAIAPHFASTRFAVWPRVRAFLEGLSPGALIADVGCGNGKYFGVRPDVFVLGSDRSEGLALVAARRLAPRPAGKGLRADVAVADGMALPHRPGCCDGVLCIAVLHHIASPARRLALLRQLLRVLRPGGRALVTVWATQQENMRKAAAAARTAARSGGAASLQQQQQQVQQPPPPSAAAASASQQQQQQQPQPLSPTPPSAAPAVDAAKGTVVFRRYYHLFAQGELDALVGQLGPQAALVDSFYDRDNWCCVYERVR